MSSDSFDCVVVGARCAGAPLATHLARAGMKVCVVDAAKLPSDQPFSTHAIQPSGMDSLDELGVGEQIRAFTPAAHTNRLVVGGSHVDMRLAAGRHMYCPRRSRLDPLLQETAVSAGAELRDETAVLEVLRDGERITGVRARHAGKTVDLRARFVIGADGRNSTVARLVGAEEYYAVDNPRGGYWGYFPVTPAFARLPFQTYIEIQGSEARFAFLTDGNLVVSGALTAAEGARAWRSDIEAHVTDSLARSEVLSTVLEGGNRAVTRFVGLLKARSFFRTATGPGWALVGDAGLHKDPTPGYGITDALRDAKALSLALLDGRDAALELYWRERDVASLPLYANACAMGALDYDNPFNEIVLAHIDASPALGARLRDAIDRKITPFELVSTGRVLGWAFGALLRGNTAFWPHFIASGKRGTWVKEELVKRRRLRGAARDRLGLPAVA